MQTLLLIVLGLAPAVALRYAILRQAISRAATAGTCFGILIYVAILVSTMVEKKFQRPGEDQLMGPLPVLADLVAQMFYVGVPVIAGSYFILRRGADQGDN